MNTPLIDLDNWTILPLGLYERLLTHNVNV
jgi:hypothetical protein